MNKSTRMRWAGHVARIGEKRNNTYRVLARKKPLGEIRRKWEDNIRMEFRER
jgi:hypothetical protein